MQQETRHRWASSINKSLPTTTIVETLDSLPQQIFNSSSSSSFCLPLTIMPNGRDRTNEFQTTVKTFASRRVRKHFSEVNIIRLFI
jgi:hypothetical protein